MRRLVLALIGGPLSLLILLLILTEPTHADILSSTPAGFTTSDSTQVSSVPIAIFLAITGSLNAWWDPEDTAEPLRHLTVVQSERGRLVRMSGLVGPLRDTRARGTLAWTLTELRGRTRVEVRFEASGDPALRLDTMAPAVDALLTDQLQRLKRFVEAGRP